MNTRRCKGKQIIYEEIEEHREDGRSLGNTSIDWMQFKEEAIHSYGNRPIREETTNPFNEIVMETKHSLARRPLCQTRSKARERSLCSHHRILEQRGPDMDSISKKITSRNGFSKVVLMIREKIVCFKEGKKLFNDDGLHCCRDE